MKYRTLGRTGIRVSQIGLGATQIGNLDVSPRRAEAVLKGALDGGVNFFDTAPRYFESEERIGRFLSHRKDEFTVATKCGPYRLRNEKGEYEAHRDYSRAGIHAAIERSRRRLRLERIGIVQFHGLPDDRSLWDEAYDALAEAKENGWVGAIGVSADGAVAVEAAKRYDWDTHEFNYNILYQDAVSDLFPLLRENDRGGIAKRPIANAVFLGNTYDEGAEANLLRERLRTFPLRDLAGSMPLIEFAIRFNLAQPLVHTMIIGTADPEHMQQNLAYGALDPLAPEMVNKAKAAFSALPH